MSHIVTGALVIAKRENGSDLYLYEGSELPDHIEDVEIKRLVALGLVGEAEADDDSEESKPAKKAAAKKAAAPSN